MTTCGQKICAALALFFGLLGVWPGKAMQLVSSAPVTNVAVAPSSSPIISANGRFVAFASASVNLAANSSGNAFSESNPASLNVFLRDRQLGITTLLSVSSSGATAGNGDSFPTGISSNGQYVVFESDASNLVPHDTNSAGDVFVRDTINNITWLVSVAANGVSGNGRSQDGVMTPDGRYVAFVSAANNLVSGDTNGLVDVFVRDLQSNATTLVSVGATQPTTAQIPNGTPYTAGAASVSPVISTNGRYVAFYSTALGLVSDVSNIGALYVRDLVAGTNVWINSDTNILSSSALPLNYALSADGSFIAFQTSGGLVLRYNTATGATDDIQTNQIVLSDVNWENRELDISADGRFVAFVSSNSPTGAAVKLWDADSGAISLISSGEPGIRCDFPRIDTSDGYVFFSANETNLTSTSDGNFHVYRRDTTTSTIQMVDVGTNGTSPISFVTTPFHLSSDGSLVVFDCQAGTLGADPYENNVFVRDLNANATEIISAPAPTLPSLTAQTSSELSRLSISSNGQFVVFTTDSYYPTPGDTNALPEVYLHDFATGSNTLISVATDGVTPGNGPSFNPAISASGRYVIYCSGASNLVASDTDGAEDIFVCDLQSNTTTLVAPTGVSEANGNLTFPAISADGRFALFASTAANLVTNTVHTETNVYYWRDLQKGMTVAVTPNGAVAAAMTPDGSNVAWVDTHYGYVWRASTQTGATLFEYLQVTAGLQDVAISPDGQKAVFGVSQGMVIGSSQGIYVADVVAGTNSLLADVEPTTRARFQFSGDGRFLACLTAVSNTNQVFLYDLVAQTNVLISRAYDGFGPGNGACDSPAFSPDGRYIAYRSFANNLVPGDNNGQPDIFLFDRLSGETTLISASYFGPYSANGRSLTPVFSGDGRTLVFESWASDLAPGDFNGVADIFALSLGLGALPAGTNEISTLEFSGIESVDATISSGQPLLLTWPSVPGVGYEIEFTDDLNNPNWQILPSPPSVVGAQGAAIDASPNAAHRFYRIIAF